MNYELGIDNEEFSGRFASADGPFNGRSPAVRRQADAPAAGDLPGTGRFGRAPGCRDDLSTRPPEDAQRIAGYGVPDPVAAAGPGSDHHAWLRAGKNPFRREPEKPSPFYLFGLRQDAGFLQRRIRCAEDSSYRQEFRPGGNGACGSARRLPRLYK